MALSLSKSANSSFSLRLLINRLTTSKMNNPNQARFNQSVFVGFALFVWSFRTENKVTFSRTENKGDVGLRITCCNNIVSIKG